MFNQKIIKMKTLNFEEFELSKESLSKVTGGTWVITGGMMYENGGVWCESDHGNSDDQSRGGYHCCSLNANGFCK